jgi:hypothetical protein
MRSHIHAAKYSTYRQNEANPADEATAAVGAKQSAESQ